MIHSNKYVPIIYRNDIHGILLLDKPKGISSNKILQKIKKIFFVKKLGYIGTLDPLATGILPICLGLCTKFSDYLIKKKKTYRTIAKFGQITTTYDSEGIVLEERNINFSENDLYDAIKKLQGNIIQVIPSYSAKKYKGVPLYKYARKNIFIPKIQKNVYIYQLRCIKYNRNFIELEIICSKGTYVRTLIHDLGKLLQCGAHVVALRRIQFFSYNISDTINVKNLYHINRLSFIDNDKNIFLRFFIPIKKFFFQLPEINFFSDLPLSCKNDIYPIPRNTEGIYRIIVKNKNNIFIIGKINQYSRLISYKIFNMK
ncbi:tRNA pseudouridine(55) synthase TruB [Buchnera aphidicola]|uniref:tRNA pseudouridine(55) synthase TruB n=1 Tax=Buchnera aphidicola TaxID=9 RepID=UPI003463B5AB